MVCGGLDRTAGLSDLKNQRDKGQDNGSDSHHFSEKTPLIKLHSLASALLSKLLEGRVAPGTGNGNDPIVQTSLMHAQFELIHPFDDGNGRIGRLLIPPFLTKRGSLVGPSLYVSGYLESNQDEYYSSLSNISRNDNWLRWIDFLLKAVIHQADSNLRLVREITSKDRAAQYLRMTKDEGIVSELRRSGGRRSAILSFDELWDITG